MRTFTIEVSDTTQYKKVENIAKQMGFEWKDPQQRYMYGRRNIQFNANGSMTMGNSYQYTNVDFDDLTPELFIYLLIHTSNQI